MLTWLFFLFSQASAIKKSYIVYLGSHSHGSEISDADLDPVTDSHLKFLGSFLGSREEAKDAIFYSYKRHINGFAASLDEEKAAEIVWHPKVLSVFRNQGKKLHMSHLWEFMLLEKDSVIDPSFGKNTIIANLDTGVWPESESFNDKGYGPIPLRWKGHCEKDTNAGVLYNRKLIGPRYFYNG